ncbi:hypothetical protein [Cerasicoccus maritimus]|uniref:hypothetical protein n=1 Tax=Cerasicoccus maritimus TaxID=490089 RepID=UPI0028528293|nr:hypothetical protein [Cerasicoccus maritimus]
MISFRCLQLYLLPLLIVLPALHAEKDSEELNAALRELDALYAEVLPWMAQLYDPESGGFYESIGLKEGKEPGEYGPDIQSTFFAIIILKNTGLLETMPTHAKEKMIHYFQSRQDPQTGYFVDPDYPDMWDNQRVLGRALSFSVGSLEMLGSEPLYPLPGQARKSATTKSSDDENPSLRDASKQIQDTNETRTGKTKNIYIVPNDATLSKQEVADAPPHLASVEAFRLWLDKRPWDYSWTALDNLSSQSRLINALPPKLRNALINEAIRYVSAIQEPDTGLIGGGDPQVRISGAFKFVSFCKNSGRPVPRADKLQTTIGEWFTSDPDIDKIFFIRNACDMLFYLSRQTGQKPTEQELVNVVKFATNQLKQFRQDDGAFRSFTSGSFVSPNDLYIDNNSISAQAGDQSEMNGTSNAHRAWKAVYWIIDKERPRMTMDNFWEVCLQQDIPLQTESAGVNSIYIVP